MIYDAHFHTDEASLLQYMQANNIEGIVNAASPQEFQRLSTWLKPNDTIKISAGIHPWYAQRSSWEQMLPIMEQASIIGEIGLDNVWCDVDFSIQAELFERSLAYAAQSRKPVILHLKGLEKEALPLLKKYKNHYFVHWYSCDSYLEEYIALDCYFSIGPSVYKDQAVQQVVKQVPLQRLLSESDGLSALSWCEQRPVSLQQYSSIMQRTVSCMEAITGQSHMEVCLNQNLKRFIAFSEA